MWIYFQNLYLPIAFAPKGKSYSCIVHPTLIIFPYGWKWSCCYQTIEYFSIKRIGKFLKQRIFTSWLFLSNGIFLPLFYFNRGDLRTAISGLLSCEFCINKLTLANIQFSHWNSISYKNSKFSQFFEKNF